MKSRKADIVINHHKSAVKKRSASKTVMFWCCEAYYLIRIRVECALTSLLALYEHLWAVPPYSYSVL